MIFRRILSTAVAFLCSFAVAIAAETLPSQVNVERGWDSAEGRDYFVDADVDLSGPRIFIGYGESDSQSGTTVLNTTTTQFEVSSNPLDELVIAIGFSEWGQENEINIKTYRVDFTYNSDDWSFTIAPQTRDIELRTLLMMRPVLTIDSDGINLGASYFGAEPLYLGIVYSLHDYSRNLASLASDPRLALIFSPATMEHAVGFEKERLAAALGVSFDWGSIGIDGTRSISEVDDSVSTSIAASVRYKFDKHWSMTGRVGQSDNSFATGKITFASIGGSYTF